MRRTIRLETFKNLTEADKVDVVRDVVREALRSPNGEIKVIDAEIRAFERRYEMTSDRMQALVTEGQYAETDDIANWLMDLELKRRIVARARP